MLERLLVRAEEGEYAAGGDQHQLSLGAAHRHGQAAGVEEEVAAGEEVLAVAFGGADEGGGALAALEPLHGVDGGPQRTAAFRVACRQHRDILQDGTLETIR